MPRQILSILALVSLLGSTYPAPTHAATNAVKTANYFLRAGTDLEDPEIFNALAKYDVIVIPAEAQIWNPTFSDDIRATNPEIIILAYVPTVSYNDIWSDPLHASLKSRIKSSEWLRDTDGDQVSIWPGTRALDLTSTWRNTLADYVATDILDDDYWDGVFYDEVSDAITWAGDVQLSSSGSNKDDAWIDAYTDLFKITRDLVGEEKIIISNGSSQAQHAPYVNGRLFESFPTPWEGDGSWSTVMGRYLTFEEQIQSPEVILIDADTGDTGNNADYQSVRFGLSSTLLGDGYFGFSYGMSSHGQTWWYDEYDAFLGEAKESAQTDTGTGIWERDFTHGKVVVNPTNTPVTFSLGGEFEKLHGAQDPTTNNGGIVSRITLPALDGLLLLRPIEEMSEGIFLNGAFAKIFTANGTVKRTGFFTYDEDVYGGLQVIHTDLDHDGDADTVAADANQVFIYDADGSLHASFYPYTSAYKEGVNISVGDLEGDGSVEIVTGTENGGGAHIRVFNSDGILINPGFFGYDKAFRGGVNVSIGDLNGDGFKEIIAGAGVGGGPHVRVFNKHGAVINPGFFAYDEMFRGGVNVSCGDTDGDGVDEIVTGPGDGGAPEVRVYDLNGIQKTTPFYALDAKARDGVEISATDVDGDDIAEIITFTRDVFTLTDLSYGQ